MREPGRKATSWYRSASTKHAPTDVISLSRIRQRLPTGTFRFPLQCRCRVFSPRRMVSVTGQRILFIQGLGNDDGKRTGFLQNASFQGALEAKDTALWILVGGYTGEGDDRTPAGASSICGAADPLCLFAPWRGTSATGTSQSTPQVSAALDTVWAVWPDMDVLDLRNLAF